MTKIWDSANVVPSKDYRVPVDVSSSGPPSHVTLGDILGEVIYVPSDPTGATDMAAEFETFIASNQGHIVKTPSNATILLRAFGKQGNLGSADEVLINFGKTKILWDNDSRCIDLDNTANASAEVSVSSIVETQIYNNTLTSEITLASTLSASTHDWIAVYSSDANPSKSGGILGEIHQLIDDETTLKLHTTGLIKRSSEFLTTVKCRVLDSSRRVYIEGGIFISNGDADSAAITVREECIRIIGFVDPLVVKPEFDAPWAQCVWFQCCGGARIIGETVKNTLNLAASNGYTYGVVFYGMNGNALAKDITVRNGRHPAGTTDGNSSTTPTWYNKGYPTNYVFTDIVGYNCYGTLVDSHEEGFGGLIQNVKDHNPVEEANGFTGSVLQSRAAQETIKDISSIGGSRGIKIAAVDHGFVDEVKLSGITLRDKHNGSVTAKAIDISSQDALTNKRNVSISKSNIDDVDIGIGIGKDVYCTLDGVEVSRAEAYGDAGAGCYIICTNMISDHQNTTAVGATYVFFVRSDEGKSPTIVVPDNPIVIKGSASNQPTHFFDERDTNDDKFVYHGGIIEVNKNSVTPTISKEVGETTFVDYTGVSTIDGQIPQSVKVAPINVLAENIKVTLPVNSSDVLSGTNDAAEILPHIHPSWVSPNPDLSDYEHPLYYKVNKDYIEFSSPTYGAYTATATVARCEYRYNENVPAGNIIHRKYIFAVQSMPTNAKANIGQIHRLSADPVFKMSYSSKTAGAGTLRCLVKKTDGAADTTTTLLTGITEKDLIEVEYKYDPTAQTLDFWVKNLTDGTVATHQDTGVQDSGFASYSKLGMYTNNAGDGLVTDLMVVRVYKDQDMRIH